MLNVSTETINQLINLAREFHSQESVSLPEVPESPGAEWVARMLASNEEDPVFQAFEVLVNDLEPDQQQEIVALMWLGREDYTIDEWDTALAQAEYLWNEQTARYLIAHPLLAHHLNEGLAQHGFSCV